MSARERLFGGQLPSSGIASSAVRFIAFTIGGSPFPQSATADGVRVRELRGALKHAGKQLVQVERLRERRELPRPAKLELCPPELVGAARAPRA